jgi:hypothetical protein
MATKGRINVIVAPTNKVDPGVAGVVPGGTNGVLFIDNTGGLNKLKLIMPNGDIFTSSVNAAGYIEFIA